MRIGLTYTGTEWKHANYVRWLKAEDADIEVVRLEAGAVGGGIGGVAGGLTGGAAGDVMAGLDGLVLSGGVDIAPSFYGGAEQYVKAPKNGWQPLRDGFELSVLEDAWKRGLPVLGVCRGLQLINVARQGSLVQDLGTEGDAVHENVTGVDKEHGVRVEGGTLLSAVVSVAGEYPAASAGRDGIGDESSAVGAGRGGIRHEGSTAGEGRGGIGHEAAGGFRGVVNSAHHQAVARLGADLRVNCRAEDGTIEGLEWEEPAGKPFLLAVQWHPERMYVNGVGDRVLYRAIRDRFVEEITRSL